MRVISTNKIISTKQMMFSAVLAATFATAAAAHHGWSWAEGEQTELRGTIEKVTMGGPHPALDVATSNDGLWRVELANPRQTERSGFVEGSAKKGDPIIAIGNRSLDANEKRMKAVRITVAGKRYDIYPERIQTN